MRRANVALLLLIVLSLGAAALAVLPSAANNPFEEQTAGTIERLYLLRSWAPAVTLALAVASLGLACRVWSRSVSWSVRSVSAAALILGVAAAVLAREHLIEWMFAPIETIRFVEASEVTHVAQGDMVLGVAVGNEARAYPVLMTAYYHIVNDELADEPYVVTY